MAPSPKSLLSGPLQPSIGHGRPGGRRERLTKKRVQECARHTPGTRGAVRSVTEECDHPPSRKEASGRLRDRRRPHRARRLHRNADASLGGPGVQEGFAREGGTCLKLKTVMETPLTEPRTMLAERHLQETLYLRGTALDKRKC